MGERSFFVESGAIQGERAEIRGPIAHQIGRVLRLRPGDSVDLLDNSGALFVAVLTDVSRDTVRARIVERRRPETEPEAHVDLYQALLKGQKMDLVLQKATEIGVSRFVPVLSERCVSRPSHGDLEGKVERWQAIVREAAEQSGRAVIPEIGHLEEFDRALISASAADLAVIAWEEERGVSLARLLRDWSRGSDAASSHIALFIGPEGGFSPLEAERAVAAGLRTVGLGPRILRAETAAIVATTAVLWETGGLGG